MAAVWKIRELLLFNKGKRDAEGRLLDDARPIAMGNVMFKVAAKLVSKHMQPAIGRIMPVQMGCGESNGTSICVGAVRRGLGDGCTVVHWDIENAFGSVKRSELLSAALKEWPSLEPFVRYLLGNEDSHLSQDSRTFLNMVEGLCQGDSTSSCLFALVFALFLIQAGILDMGVRLDDLKSSVANADDFAIILDDPSKVERIVEWMSSDRFKLASDKFGLRLNMSKTILAFSRTALHRVHGDFDVNQLAIWSPDGSEVVDVDRNSYVYMGCEMSLKTVFIEAHAKTKVDEALRLADLMIDVLAAHPQHALEIVRRTIHPRLYYLLRNSDADAAKVAWKEFDQRHFKNLLQLFCIPEDLVDRTDIPNMIELMGFPTKLGGLGVQLDLENLAKVTNIAVALDTMHRVEDGPMVRRAEVFAQELYGMTLLQLQENIASGEIYTTMLGGRDKIFDPSYRSRKQNSQSVLTNIHNALKVLHIRQKWGEVPDQKKRHHLTRAFDQLIQPVACIVRSMKPTFSLRRGRHKVYILGSSFVAYVQYMYMAPFPRQFSSYTDATQIQCQARHKDGKRCKAIDISDFDISTWEHCLRDPKCAWGMRCGLHDCFVSCIGYYCTANGVSMKIEEPTESPDDFQQRKGANPNALRRRMDVTLALLGELTPHAVDVSFVAVNGSKTPLSQSVGNRITAKRTKYREDMERLRYRFTPAVISTYGGLQDDFTKLVVAVHNQGKRMPENKRAMAPRRLWEDLAKCLVQYVGGALAQSWGFPANTYEVQSMDREIHEREVAQFFGDAAGGDDA